MRLVTFIGLFIVSFTLFAQQDSIYTSLADSSLNPDQIIQLDLSDNNLSELPAVLFQCLNLEQLNLSQNQLSELPEALGRFIKLRHLNLSQNNLEGLPKSFKELNSLKKLMM